MIIFVSLRSKLIPLFVVAALGGTTACFSAASPKMTVLGDGTHSRDGVVFLQVTNPANRPLRVQKLEYTFAAGSRVQSGEVSVLRDIPAGAAVVVEVPIDPYQLTAPLRIRGRLVTLLDQIVTSYPVNAVVTPRS
jgi:hypothetical protein